MERFDSARFDISRIIGDPFALATISISMLAWLIAFVSSIIGEKALKAAFPDFAWWALVFQLLIIIIVTVVVGYEAEENYNIAIVGYLAAGIVFTSSAVNSLIYSSNAANEAAAAGFILLSMVSIIWIAYYGSKPFSNPRAYVDSFALHKSEKSYRGSQPMSNRFKPRGDSGPAAPKMYTSAQLNGFETSSPVSGFAGGPIGGTPAENRNSMPRFGTAGGTMTPNTSTPAGEAADAAGASAVAAPPAEYPYRAKAIYSYEANPDDANEISFAKHEILEVSDVSGRWWQAKKENGETGIAPSNYLILL